MEPSETRVRRDWGPWRGFWCKEHTTSGDIMMALWMMAHWAHAFVN